ncbi:trihelix transcription factor GTL1 isoform X2 [Sesamum indicum]|uniref:Trihelix transcription factor GTL1 isoform X2 n=1 Tax=Sesamum indicum TaxID=4182 RepID=A0A6I9TEV7_SESIN|nr:trihelix transcription factor GTL1 isoform X2 [Sesamum indicum]
MQHQQQEGGGGPQSLGGYPQVQPQSAPPEVVISSDEHQKFGDLGIAEAASPISSRPPAPGAIANNDFEEVIRATAEGAGGASGNRWPRQETLALLQIRSEMDTAFRDATLKGPLWEQVSRKLAELGYKRSAKKCKEKFENVHKYYKRTKEGRAGRQDGKSYKFFSQLEALQHSTATAIPTTHSPLQVLPRIPNHPTSVSLSLPPAVMPQPEGAHPPPAAGAGTAATRDAPAVSLFNAFGVSSSSNSSSSSEGEDDQDEDEEEDVEMELTGNPHNRKRKRSHRAGSADNDERMMDFFEGLMKQVMQKQEAMQQKFLEAIEKREQDRMIREEAWKRQDMARLAREHELTAQERAISASRDAAIIAFLQKITGQTIHLPTAVPRNPPPSVPVSQPPPSGPQQQPTFPEQQQSLSQTHPKRRDQQGVSSHHPLQTQTLEIVEAHDQLQNTSETVAAAIPEQQMPLLDFTGGSSSLEVTSSRWPKAEVLALIKLRSSLESRYQEAGPKGPLWEEISSGMQRMGYNRNAKRCKEKWENINKYFKKVKESNKKRSEDSKTCPYFNELDALYRKKVIGNTGGNVTGAGGGGSSGILGSLPEQEKQQQQQGIGMLSLESLKANVSEDKDGAKTQAQTSSVGAYSSGLFGEQSQGNIGGAKQKTC